VLLLVRCGSQDGLSPLGRARCGAWDASHWLTLSVCIVMCRCVTTLSWLQVAIPSTRLMLRELPVVWWILVAVIAAAVVMACWRLQKWHRRHNANQQKDTEAVEQPQQAG
jgi:dolichyl-phosphate-mannose--protein O-mannosyl transferase